MILRWKERSDDRKRFFATCWVIEEPPCTTSLACKLSARRAEGAEDVDTPVLEEAPVLGGERGLDHRIGDVVERHGVVVQDAALADLVAVLIEEFDGELAGEELALVELMERRNGEREHDDEAAGAERQGLGRGLVEQALPAGELEAGEKAGAGIPAVAHRRPGLRER